ncbi:MAG: phage tail assembly protein [Litorimonas sp.]
MKTVTLDKPISRGSGTDATEIEKIDVRPPTAGELRGVSLADLSQLETETVLQILPRVTTPSLSLLEAESLSIKDIMALAVAILGGDAAKAGNAPGRTA